MYHIGMKLAKRAVKVKALPDQGLEMDFLVSDRVERELRRRIARLQGVPGAMLPNQEDLGRDLGVSRRSVREAVNRLKREKLIQSIQGKGTFVLETRKKLTDVLLVCNNVYHPYQMMCTARVTALLKELGYTASLVISADPAEEWDTITAGRPEVCGAVFIGRYSRKVFTQLANRSRISLVCLSDPDEAGRSPAVCDMVLPSSEALAYHCTDYLVRQGHRKIAYVVWGPSRTRGYGGLRGYTDALDAHGLPFNPDFIVSFPALPFGPELNEEFFHGPIGETQRQIDGWFENNDPPTGLIHAAAYEIQLRDMLHFYFHGHFQDNAVVALLYKEQLQMGYNGLTEATAVCTSFESLARRALELLFRPRAENEPPVREIQEKVYFYRRKDGRWREEPFIPD